jgi:hypothetical protein
VFGPRWRRRVRPAWLTALGTRPASDHWGFDRGTPVDRYYIAQFLAEHRGDIHGRVLEVRDSEYTDRFGAGVIAREVLDIDAANPRATIVADLAANVPGERCDCFILTQTLQFVYDVRAAVMNARGLLCPGGVLLATMPAVSRVAPRAGLDADYWRFTRASCTRLFGDVFGADAVSVRTYGNVYAATAFLRGMALEELSRRKLDRHDPYFPVIIAVRAERW